MSGADLRALIRDIPDFPKPGIVFKDITPLLLEPRAVDAAVRGIADYARPHEVLDSEDAKEHAGDGAVEFELVGDVPLRGVRDAVRLHRASRA